MEPLERARGRDSCATGSPDTCYRNLQQLLHLAPVLLSPLLEWQLIVWSCAGWFSNSARVVTRTTTASSLNAAHSVSGEGDADPVPANVGVCQPKVTTAHLQCPGGVVHSAGSGCGSHLHVGCLSSQPGVVSIYNEIVQVVEQVLLRGALWLGWKSICQRASYPACSSTMLTLAMLTRLTDLYSVSVLSSLRLQSTTGGAAEEHAMTICIPPFGSEFDLAVT